jgi:hypothetical protein
VPSLTQRQRVVRPIFNKPQISLEVNNCKSGALRCVAPSRDASSGGTVRGEDSRGVVVLILFMAAASYSLRCVAV